jgi:hypothetical protein
MYFFRFVKTHFNKNTTSTWSYQLKLLHVTCVNKAELQLFLCPRWLMLGLLSCLHWRYTGMKEAVYQQNIERSTALKCVLDFQNELGQFITSQDQTIFPLWRFGVHTSYLSRLQQTTTYIPYTLAGFDLTTQISNLLGGRRRHYHKATTPGQLILLVVFANLIYRKRKPQTGNSIFSLEKRSFWFRSSQRKSVIEHEMAFCAASKLHTYIHTYNLNRVSLCQGDQMRL